MLTLDYLITWQDLKKAAKEQSKTYPWEGLMDDEGCSPGARSLEQVSGIGSHMSSDPTVIVSCWSLPPKYLPFASRFPSKPTEPTVHERVWLKKTVRFPCLHKILHVGSSLNLDCS